MIRIAMAAGLAIGVGLGGVATAQSVHLSPPPQAARALLVGHDHGKHKHGKNKHREQVDDGDDEDNGRARRSAVPGAWRGYEPPPNYYYPPPASSYATPYERSAPAGSFRPAARVGTQPIAPASPPAAASTQPNPGNDRSGSSAPSIQWVDPAPAR